jgi:hypothetical protein
LQQCDDNGQKLLGAAHDSWGFDFVDGHAAVKFGNYGAIRARAHEPGSFRAYGERLIGFTDFWPKLW